MTIVQDRNLKTGDEVDFVDADGCYVSSATVRGVRDDLAIVHVKKFKQDLVVRTCDLIKLVDICNQ